jgi:hypothetical protein
VLSAITAETMLEAIKKRSEASFSEGSDLKFGNFDLKGRVVHMFHWIKSMNFIAEQKVITQL